MGMHRALSVGGVLCLSQGSCTCAVANGRGKVQQGLNARARALYPRSFMPPHLPVTKRANERGAAGAGARRAFALFSKFRDAPSATLFGPYIFIFFWKKQKLFLWELLTYHTSTSRPRTRARGDVYLTLPW
jgi:hypothetical protein